MHWVYANKGFEKNEGYFAWKKLGPTPIQVLEKGGDCADKSRLLSSLLREIDIPSTLAMCFNKEGNPTHTIVDAEVEPGKRMLLDPIWDLHFPKETPGEYYSLLDLRRNPQILWDRLDQVTAVAPANAKIHRYNRAHDVYDWATTINWDKNDALRSVRDLLAEKMGDRVYALSRPAFTEEPKLFAGMALAFGSLGMMGLYGIGNWLLAIPFRRRVKKPAGAPAPASLQAKTWPTGFES